MTDTQEVPTYAERMEAFPDVNEELEKYTEEAKNAEIQKYIARYFAMVKALNMGRTHHVRVNSWKRPEPHRADGSPMTKQSRGVRRAKNRNRAKIAKLSRMKNR